MRSIIGGLAALLLSGCAMLTAERPLLSPQDQDGVFALAEGLWAYRGAGCAVDPATSSPETKDCIDWARIAREDDGAWRITFIGEDDPPMRLVVMPAVASEAGRLAPLYVVEATSSKQTEPAYAIIVPRGDLSTPVRRVAFDAIACTPLLREGEPADIVFTRGADGRVTGCTAKTREAVRDAARRAVFDALAELGDEEIVFVR
jgi:hypothetical protein